MIVLSHYQAAPLLVARAAGNAEAVSSPDLGMTTAVFPLTPLGVALPDGQSLTWQQLETIASNKNNCFHIVGNEAEKITFFSDYLNRAYSLMPAPSAPTMLVAGFPMHRIKNSDPHQHTKSMIRAAAPVSGTVLDTTMGLGYMSIMASETAVSVTVIELDPTVVEVCRHNPWSAKLFTAPNITRRIGSSFDEISTFPDQQFDRILHDPPTFKLAGDLYSAEFYEQTLRVLKPKGRLFHYIGDPSSKSGASVTRGAVRRLKEAGYRRVKPAPAAFGVVAYKN